jgi:hypothetical protein
LEVVALAWPLVADFPAPPVDVAVAAEQPDALQVWSPVLAYFRGGWVEPQVDLADSPPACSAASRADALELPPAGCSPDGCSAAPLVDGSVRAGCCSAEPPADARAPQSTGSLPAADYWAALPEDGLIPQADGSVPLRGGLADC